MHSNKHVHSKNSFQQLMQSRDAKCTGGERECKNGHPPSSMHFLNGLGCSLVRVHRCTGTLPPWSSTSRHRPLAHAASSRLRRGTPRRSPTPHQAAIEVLRVACQHHVEVTAEVCCIEVASEVLLCPRRVEVAHSPCPPRPRPRLRPLACPRARLLL
jgi:hypothetical protein